MNIYGYIAVGYLIVINIIAVALTVYDKNAPKMHLRRIRERTLMVLAALSGCVMMYATMKIIRHKTLHPKFMIGIPVIFGIECAAALYIFLCTPIFK